MTYTRNLWKIKKNLALQKHFNLEINEDFYFKFGYDNCETNFLFVYSFCDCISCTDLGTTHQRASQLDQVQPEIRLEGQNKCFLFYKPFWQNQKFPRVHVVWSSRLRARSASPFDFNFVQERTKFSHEVLSFFTTFLPVVRAREERAL